VAEDVITAMAAVVVVVTGVVEAAANG